MTNEYTPTTAAVQVCYAVGRFDENRCEGQAEFQRWMAKHDRMVAAKTLRETAKYLSEPYRLWHGDFGITVSEFEGQKSLTQPTLIMWLERRATRIEQDQAL